MSDEPTPSPAAETPAGFRPVHEVIEALPREEFFSPLEERFGFPGKTFEPFLLYRPNSKVLSIVNRDLLVPVKPPSRYFGMPLLHQKARRLTTGATQRFAPFATRNLFDLNDEQLEDFVMGREFTLAEPQVAQLAGGGFVIARHRGLVLGQASYRAADGNLRGLVPKSWRPQLY